MKKYLFLLFYAITSLSIAQEGIVIPAPVSSVAGRQGAITLTCSDLTNGSASCSTDATNASNISSGTLPTARLATTGTGNTFVLSSSPTLITPVLGAATATSINFGDSTFNTYKSGTWTPTSNNLNLVGGSLTLTGNYTKIGNITYFLITVSAGGGTTASVRNSTSISLPSASSGNTVCYASDAAVNNYGTGAISGSNCFTPTWAATGNDIYISGFYF